jgi:hypothetical protein
MRRREFIALMGGVGAKWPFVARSQQTRVTRIGVVLQGGLYYAGVEGLREGLKAAGLEDGKQIMFVIRDSKGDAAAAAAAARELEGDGVVLIVAFATTGSRHEGRHCARADRVRDRKGPRCVWFRGLNAEAGRAIDRSSLPDRGTYHQAAWTPAGNGADAPPHLHLS